MPGVRRGRHATLSGQGFSWQVLWTIVGAVVPGAGMIAAGRRSAGLLMLGLFLAVGVAAGLFVALGDPMSLVITLAADQTHLLMLAGGIVALAVCWAAVMIAGNVALSRLANLGRGQRTANLVLVTALVAAVGLPAYQGAQVALLTRDVVSSVFTPVTKDSPPPLAKVDPWAAIPRVNVLLLGSDAGEGRKGVRPDTLIVASINTKTGDTVLLSLPRNLQRVPFREGTPADEQWPQGFNCPKDCLLNAVWTWGVNNAALYPDDPNPGLTATISAVEGATDLDIDYTAMVNLDGFESVVDAIGGITVDVKRRLPIGGGKNERTGALLKIYGYIEKGDNQKLDGYHALWFARSRWLSTDYDRMERQRCTIGAIAEKADPLTLVRSYPALAASAKKNISTTIPASDLPQWADLTLKVKEAGIRSLTFTNQVISTGDPDYDLIHELVRNSLTPPAPEPVSSTPSPSVSPSAPTATSDETDPAKTDPAKADPEQSVRVDDVC